MQNTERNWQVLLIGGASGTGKTSVSYRLARHFGVGITEVDDFQVLLHQMTTPEQQPVLHFWKSHPNPGALSPEEIIENGMAIGRVMLPGLEAVIANHLESNTPIILEGDFILPVLATQAAFGDIPNIGRVKAVFLIELDEDQLRRNYLQREPDSGDQSKRARVSWLYGQWLTGEAQRCGVPIVQPRPWHDVFERVIAAIEQENL
jgi:2-phosphoglycerate kinase